MVSTETTRLIDEPIKPSVGWWSRRNHQVVGELVKQVFGGEQEKTTRLVCELKKQIDYNSIRIIVKISKYGLESGYRYQEDIEPL